MKKAAALILVLLMTLGCLSIQAAAAEASPVTVIIDGQVLNVPDAQPEIVNGRAFVPLSAIVTAMNQEVEWDDNTKTVTLYFYEAGELLPSMTHKLGTTYGTYVSVGAGETVDIGVPSYIKNGRIMVGVRMLVAALHGNAVEWDANNRAVIITRVAG